MTNFYAWVDGCDFTLTERQIACDVFMAALVRMWGTEAAVDAAWNARLDSMKDPAWAHRDPAVRAWDSARGEAQEEAERAIARHRARAGV